MSKVILSIGAGFAQEEFADAVKTRGYNLISVGKGINSPHIISISNQFVEIDTHSFEEVDSWLRNNRVIFDAAGSFAGGGAILTLQKINNKYGMPTRIPENLMVGMDKFSQVALYRKYHLTSIQSWNVNALKEVPKDINEYVVKPSMGRGSAGVEFVSRTTLIEMLNQQRIPSDYIIQEFRRGVEYRVLILVQESKIKLLAPVERKSYRHTSFLGRLTCSTKELNRIQEYCERMIHKMNISNSIIKCDILVSKNHIDMIEMDISVGGGIYFKRFVERIFETDIINLYIDLILNIPFKPSVIQNPDLIMDYVYNETGHPFELNSDAVNSALNQKIQCDYSVIYNKLKPWKTGKFGSNADFICAIVHRNHDVKADELSIILNNSVFKKCGNGN